jgi:hypothetical protein
VEQRDRRFVVGRSANRFVVSEVVWGRVLDMTWSKIANVALVAVTAAFAALGPTPSQAASGQPQGFFQRLFGLPGGGFFGSPFAARPRQPNYASRPKRQPRVVSQRPADTVVILPKDPAAKKILIVGDYVADSLAWGLDQELANEPKLAVINRSNAGSGLVRQDYYDWNKTLPELLNQEKPDVVVVALGSNDRQQLRQGNERFAIRSAEWEKAYLARVDSLVETLKVFGRPFFWVGAPPVRNEAVSADMAYLDTLFKVRVEAAGGSFVDIWNGFADPSGTFLSTGADAEGRVRPLRTGDGINFTPAGQMKLGFFLQRDLQLKAGIGVGATELAPSASQESRIEVGPDGKKVLVGPVISLTDPLPTSARLAGGTDGPMPSPDSVQFKVLVKGEVPPTVRGRVDDYVWPSGPAPATTAMSSALPSSSVNPN